MTKYLLDSTALIDWLKGRPKAVALLKRLSLELGPLAVNPLVVAETYSGLAEAEIPATDHLLSQFDFWTIDFATARLAGWYRYSYARQGRALAASDTLIAAQAVREDATLVTENVRGFPMPELKILRYDQ